MPGKDGVTVVDATSCARELRGAIESPHDRTVTAPVQTVKPEVTTDELAQKYPTYLTIDRGAFQLRLWKNLKLVKTYTIAVGQQGLETPAGTYTIDDKQVNPSWHVPDSAWAGEPRRDRSIPPGPDEPDQGALDGFLQRRRHPRHRRGRLARHRGLARLRADVDPRRDRRCTTRSRSAPRSTSAN